MGATRARRVLPARQAGNGMLERPQGAEPSPAVRAGRDVSVGPLPLRRGQRAVEARGHAFPPLRASAHDLLPFACVDHAASTTASLARPRAIRERTGPTGHPVILAISPYSN